MSLQEFKSGYNPPPRGLQKLGMLLVLAALFMFFAAMMLSYVIIRIHSPYTVPAHAVRLPSLLWASTALILGVSICFHGALKSVRRERQVMMQRWLVLSAICAAGFIAVQTPALIELFTEYHRLGATKGLVLLCGLVFIFIAIHAAHVFGGLIALVIVVRNGSQGKYDHEHHYGLSNAAMYWHFLDAVWLVMFGIFWLLG